MDTPIPTPIPTLIPAPDFDSFYAAIQRRHLLSQLFGVKHEGEQLDYKIIGELGRGGMGIVYEAHHHELDRTVAIKRVRDRRDPHLQRRLVTEAKIMARLNHPNIVTVFDITHAEGTALIVMEYIDGVTLRHWRNHERPSTHAIVEAFIDAGEGLSAAHAEGLVHGDFKPSNVMIDRAGRVRVMDFGLGRLSENANSSTPAGGTWMYMAPEQRAGGAADARCDQYAFCVSLHRAIWGEYVESDSVEARVEDTTWAGLARIVRRGLRSDPRQRHASMRCLVDALRLELARVTRKRARVKKQRVRKALVARLGEQRRGRDKHAWALGLLCALATCLLALLFAKPSAWPSAIIPGLGVFVSRLCRPEQVSFR